MTTETQASTSKKLHSILSDLWPLLPMKDVGIVIDSSAWADGSAGFHLDDPEQMGQYVDSLPSDHQANSLVEPRYPTHLLVIDHQAAMAGGGWKELLLIGLHEFAHAIRSEMADGIYPDFHSLKKVTHYLEKRLGEDMDTEDEPPMEIFVTDELMSDVDRHLFPADGSGVKPLFGKWVVRTFQHDGGHDLLFYLVLYVLEREATDRGYFENGAEVIRSVFMPERADALLGSGPGVAP